MSNIQLIEIPFNVLEAVSLFSAKGRVQQKSRPSLCGIHVTPDYIEACDGVRALRFEHELSIDVEFLIPIISFLDLRKQLTAKQRRESDVLIRGDLDETGTLIEMTCNQKVARFQLEHINFPAIGPLILDPELYTPSSELCINWRLMNDFQKAVRILFFQDSGVIACNDKDATKPTIVKFDGYDEAIGIIMNIKTASFGV